MGMEWQENPLLDFVPSFQKQVKEERHRDF